MKHVKHWKDVPGSTVVMDGVKDAVRRLVLGPEDGTPLMALRVFTVAPGGHTPHHRHPFEHMNVILEGHGVLKTAEGDLPLDPGTMLLIRPDEVHQFTNPGPEPLSFVCLVPNEYA